MMSSSRREETFSDEISSLRRTMRDLVALSALPAIWTGYNSERIAESLADVMFWNLLSNAMKFTPKGGKIQVQLERINSQVEISVSDNGRGIPPEFLPSVFDRFSQADGSRTRSYGGLGLGLAIVRHLVELHGGKVWATSAGEGKGSTFTVLLPIAMVDQDPFGCEHPLSSARIGYNDVCGEVNLSNVRVLVVDDDSDACEMLRRVLQECKATVDTANLFAGCGLEARGFQQSQ